MSASPSHEADHTDRPHPEHVDQPVTDAHEVLKRQRAEHEPCETETDDDGVGALVNNTGLDGGAATG